MRPKRPKNSPKRKAAVQAGFRSSFEKEFADDLTERGINFVYEGTKFSYIRAVRNGSCGDCGSKTVGKRGLYLPDFYITPTAALPFYCELKGRLVSSDRTKLLAVRQSHPDLRLRILFAADNWCTKAHKQRYTSWAERNGFIFAVGRILPREWLGS